MKLAGKVFCFLLFCVGGGCIYSGVLAIYYALKPLPLGAHSDWAPWFLALVGVVFCAVGGFLMLLACILFTGKDKQ